MLLRNRLVFLVSFHLPSNINCTILFTFHFNPSLSPMNLFICECDAVLHFPCLNQPRLWNAIFASYCLRICFCPSKPILGKRHVHYVICASCEVLGEKLQVSCYSISEYYNHHHHHSHHQHHHHGHHHHLSSSAIMIMAVSSSKGLHSFVKNALV